MLRTVSVAVAATLTASSFAGVTLPVTEDFNSDAANWRNAGGAANLTWINSGSFDGSAYVSGALNFMNTVEGDTPIAFRAQDEFNSSGNAFAGDWLASGATEFSAWVRHDAPVPLSFFTRFSGPLNFPGAIGVEFAPALPNTWTQITFAIDPNNPQFVSFEGSDFASVFSNVGHIQIGVNVPLALAGAGQTFTFDLDHARLIPAPGAASVLAMSGLVALRRRR